MKNEWLPENFPRFNLCFLNDKFILINIPKNASTSVRNALSLHRREPFSNETKNSGHKKILLFEYLDRDFNDMCGDLGINKKLKWDNKSKLNVIKNKIKKLVKEDVGLIDKIKKIYSEDFTLYNKVKKMKSNGNSSNRS